MTVTFFGHSDAPDTLRDKLKDLLIDLITNRGADLYYVGNNGNFDRLVISVLKELKGIYSYIEYRVVLAYLPTENFAELANTEYPEGIELVPKRFAICFRNKWMIEQSDVVVTYVVRAYGGAAKFADKAIKNGKNVINLAKS